MKITRVRELGKRIFAKSPRAYQVAKKCFISCKLAGDRLSFRMRHRNVPYILYSARELQEFANFGFKSQYGQDHYLWNQVLQREVESTYVDIGGNEPVDLSNSFWLEQQGWSGYAFDPLPVMAERWATERPRTRFISAAVSEVQEQVAYIEIQQKEGWEHTLSGFKGNVRAEDMRMYGYRDYTVETAPLEKFLPAGFTADLVMIDVEGAEKSVVAGINFDVLKPRVVMVENVGELGGSGELRTMIENRGYKLVARVGAADDIFVRVSDAD